MRACIEGLRSSFGVSRMRAIGGRVRREEGQVLVVMVLFLTVLCGFAGLVVDVGRVYVAQRQLQQAVDAEALAAAQDLPVTATANGDVTTYSAVVGNLNAHTGMTADTPVATYKCLSSIGISCQSGSGNCVCNAIQVKETATVNTTFLRLFGVSSLTSISSQSTAGMHGGTPHPLDVAVVLDTTASMNSGCSNDVVGITNGNSTKLDCAKEGVRTLLSTLDPCNSTLASCGTVTNGNVAQPLDEVGLFAFPGITSPSAFSHDSTNARSNNSLEFGCPGNLSATPSWYLPTTGSQNEIDLVTVAAKAGNFFLQYPATTGTKTVNIAYNAPNTGTGSVTTALSSISGLSGNFTVSTPSGTIPANTHEWLITFTNALGLQNLNNPLGGGTAASPNQLTFSGGTPSINVTTSQNGSTTFPTWYLNSSDVSYPSSSNAAYTINGLSSDYRTSDSAASLTSSSSIVQAVSFAADCSGGTWPNNEYYGINAPGGAGTYIAYSINAAQAALAADSARKASPIMIVLSDGDASTQPTGSTDPCHEAIVAADAAAAAGTEVYSIAYDADNTSGSCTQDSGAYGSLTGFTTMQQIASDSSKFYCLNPPSGQTCNNASASSLAQIFAAIGVDVTNTRLLPDSTS
jgi:Flp pilus assembly protein TadG